LVILVVADWLLVVGADAERSVDAVPDPSVSDITSALRSISTNHQPPITSLDLSIPA
jgi:hypothetical protein